MDYVAIGQRIRQFRKQRGLTQEQLAEMIGISTTHMSHIETGTTKLSLPVLVLLTEALHVGADDLICTQQGSRTEETFVRISAMLRGCSSEKAQVILYRVDALKQSTDRHLPE